MYIRNDRSWSKHYAILLDTSTFLQIRWGLLGIVVYTLVLAILHLGFEFIEFKMTGIVHSILGLALGLLLVFRTNTAYDRWWEGRKLLGGLVNQSRGFVIKLSAYLNQKEDREAFQTISQWVIVYVYAFKNHLRDNKESTFENFLPTEDQRLLDQVVHKPNYIAQRIYCLLTEQLYNKRISDIQFLSLDNQVAQFTDIMGACERIKKTPMPFAYRVHLLQFLNLYIYSLPFTLLHELGYWTIAIILFTYYALMGLKVIGDEIEDPFGTDINDLPMEIICDNIAKNILALMESNQNRIPVPLKTEALVNEN